MIIPIINHHITTDIANRSRYQSYTWFSISQQLYPQRTYSSPATPGRSRITYHSLLPQQPHHSKFTQRTHYRSHPKREHHWQTPDLSRGHSPSISRNLLHPPCDNYVFAFTKQSDKAIPLSRFNNSLQLVFILFVGIILYTILFPFKTCLSFNKRVHVTYRKGDKSTHHSTTAYYNYRSIVLWYTHILPLRQST